VAGDLGRGQAAPVGEHDGLALAVRQAADRGAHLPALDRRRGARGDRRGALGQAPEALADAAGRLRLATHVERARARHEAQVRLEPAAAGVERVGPAPQPQEDVLHDVLRARVVVEHRHRRRVHAARVAGVHAGERGGVVEAVLAQRRHGGTAPS
jgi:hypothetical protein